MTQPPLDSGNHTNGAARPAMTPAPTVVMVLALMALLFGVIGLLVKGARAIALARDTSGYEAVQWFDLAQTTLGVPISLLLLAGGVGLIFMREWGRQVMLLYAGLALLMIAATAGAVLTLDLRTAEAAMMATTTQPSTLPSATTTQPVEATTRPEPTTQATPQPMAEPSAGQVWLGTVTFSVLLSLYPVWILMVLRRPDIRLAFARAKEAEGR